MTFAKSAKALLVLTLLATAAPIVAEAKPNSYPGENSKYKSSDPEVIAQQKAERAKRIEARKKRREEKRLKRLNKKNNRSN